MATRGSGEIRQGMDVFDVKGDKIGSVEEVSGGSAGYMKVKAGLLGLGGSWRISLNAIREIRSDGIHLSVAKDEAGRSGSNASPSTAGEADRVETTLETTRGGESGGRVELREEELRARKETVEAGELRVRKDVVTEQRTMDVPVTHEEAVVERHPSERRHPRRRGNPGAVAGGASRGRQASRGDRGSEGGQAAGPGDQASLGDRPTRGAAGRVRGRRGRAARRATAQEEVGVTSCGRTRAAPGRQSCGR